MTQSEKIKAGQAERRAIIDRCEQLNTLLKMFDDEGRVYYRGKKIKRGQRYGPFCYSLIAQGRFEVRDFYYLEGLEAFVNDRVTRQQVA